MKKDGELDSDEDVRYLQRLRRERTGDTSEEEVTKVESYKRHPNLRGQGKFFAALVAIGAIVKGLLELYSVLGW